MKIGESYRIARFDNRESSVGTDPHIMGLLWRYLRDVVAIKIYTSCGCCEMSMQISTSCCCGDLYLHHAAMDISTSCCYENLHAAIGVSISCCYGSLYIMLLWGLYIMLLWGILHHAAMGVSTSCCRHHRITLRSLL
jgi:hypothetical protein